VAAVEWTIRHLTVLGANPHAIFVSGHSAGGNIAANLVCGTWLDGILEKYNVKVLGAVCISGVYSLLNPLGGSMARIKNKGFDTLYRLRVFGRDLQVLARHSPVAQLRLMLGELPYPVEHCKICDLASAIASWVHPATVDEDGVQRESLIKSMGSVNTAFLVLNAGSDMGLETDGERFVELLGRVQTSTTPVYQVFHELGHATITLDEVPLDLACNFIIVTFNKFISSD